MNFTIYHNRSYEIFYAIFAAVKQKYSIMIDLEFRLMVDDDIALNEYDYLYANKKDVKVKFVYSNVVTDKETVRFFTYRDALKLARQRRNDKRYRNYVFFIEL